MEKAYIEIAKQVGIPGCDLDDSKVDKLQLVKAWFEDRNTPSWILVVDNADDVNLLYGTDGPRDKTPGRLADYFPRSSNGSILLTTRNKKVSHKFTVPRNIIAVEALTLDESRRLLAARLGDESCNEHHYTKLAEALERLPLALVQAAAFILIESSSVTDYLKLYNESDTSRIQLLCDDFEDDVRDPEIKNPTITTFAISFQQIKKYDPPAANLLSFMSMLDAQAIPRSLLPYEGDSVLFTNAMGTLKGYSLVTSRNILMPEEKQDDPQFDLHRLVRLAMHSWLRHNRELELQMANTVIALSNRVLPSKYEYRNIWATHLPHFLVVFSSETTQLLPHLSPQATELAEPFLSKQPLAEAKLRYYASWYAYEEDNHRLAEPLARDSLNMRNTILGPMHKETLDSVDLLASILRHRGNHIEVKELCLQAFNRREELLGKEDGSTWHSLNGLASILRIQGKYEAAEEKHRQSLSKYKELFGEEHPRTLSTLSHLAWTLLYQGKDEEAEQMYRQILSKRKEILGEEHPKTLSTLSCLASALTSQGKYEAADALFHEALDGFERAVGKEDLDFLWVIGELAYSYEQQGQYADAEVLYLRAYQGQEKILGAHHPKTLESFKRHHRVKEKLQNANDKASRISKP